MSHVQKLIDQEKKESLRALVQEFEDKFIKHGAAIDENNYWDARMVYERDYGDYVRKEARVPVR